MSDTKAQVCPNCNQNISSSARYFCPKCGYNIQGVYTSNTKQTIVFLLLFRPIGLFLMWKRTLWDNFIKVVITLICAAIFAFEGYAIFTHLKPHLPQLGNTDISVSQTTTQKKEPETTSAVKVIVPVTSETTTEETTTTATEAETTTESTTQTTTTETTASTAKKTTSKATTKTTTRKPAIKTTAKHTTRKTVKPTVKPTVKTTRTTVRTTKATTRTTTRTTTRPTTKPTTKTTVKTTEPTTKTVPPTTVDSEETARSEALGTAKYYITYASFSRSGLIYQLEKKGYSHENAEYAADHCGADWNVQAEIKAKEFSSRYTLTYDELLSYLEKSGFTHEQAVHGADSI